MNRRVWNEELDDDDDVSDLTFVLSCESETSAHGEWEMHWVRFFLQPTTRFLVVGLPDDGDGSGSRGANKPIIGLRVAYRLGASDAQCPAVKKIVRYIVPVSSTVTARPQQALKTFRNEGFRNIKPHIPITLTQTVTLLTFVGIHI